MDGQGEGTGVLEELSRDQILAVVLTRYQIRTQISL